MAWVFDRTGSSWSADTELSGSRRSRPAGLRLQRRALQRRRTRAGRRPDRARREGRGVHLRTRQLGLVERGAADRHRRGCRRSPRLQRRPLRRTVSRRSSGRPSTPSKRGPPSSSNTRASAGPRTAVLSPAPARAAKGASAKASRCPADGSTVLIGAPVENGKRGAVWTFVDLNTKWVEFGTRLTGIGNEKEEFGRGLALSEDGVARTRSARRARARERRANRPARRVFYKADKSAWTIVQPALEASLVETGPRPVRQDGVDDQATAKRCSSGRPTRRSKPAPCGCSASAPRSKK